jgi:hypothetical protein
MEVARTHLDSKSLTKTLRNLKITVGIKAKNMTSFKAKKIIRLKIQMKSKNNLEVVIRNKTLLNSFNKCRLMTMVNNRNMLNKNLTYL